MPCNDVTELIRIELDERERMLSYSLVKGTCSGDVGQASLLLDLVRGLTVEEILSDSANLVLTGNDLSTDLDEFMYYKHVVAIKSALAAMVGIASPYRTRVCELDEILHGPEGTRISGSIRIDLVTEEIKACGRCAGCK